MRRAKGDKQQRLPIDRWPNLPKSWKSRLTQEELTHFMQSCKVYKDKGKQLVHYRERMQRLLTNSEWAKRN